MLRTILDILALVVVLTFMAVAQTIAGETSADAPRLNRSPGIGKALDELERRLEALRVQAHIPGLSGVIVKEGELLWRHGFGYVDLANKVRATPDTPYRLASISKPLAAVLIMQLVGEGKLSLDTPMAAFPGPSRYRGAPILVRHVLSHTSEGVAGEVFRYSADAYADLTLVIEQGCGEPYPAAVEENIFKRAGMSRSVPGQLAPGYDSVINHLAKPYELVQGEVLPSGYFLLTPNWNAEGNQQWHVYGISECRDVMRRKILGDAYTPLCGAMASGGLISTVMDLARFDIALDRNRLIDEASRDLMFRPAISTNGKGLPYGLGWFVQDYKDVKLVWHHGECATISGLYLKVPAERLTFILLSTTGARSTPYGLSNGNVLVSPFATAFLDRLEALK